MGAKDNGVGEVQGVLHVPGGMLGGHVQGLEVVIVGLDLRAGHDVVARPSKTRQMSAVTMFTGWRLPANGVRPAGWDRRPPERPRSWPVTGRPAARRGAWKGPPWPVGGLPGLAALIGGQRGQEGHGLGQASLATEIGHPDLFEVLECRGLVEARQALPDQAFQFG